MLCYIDIYSLQGIASSKLEPLEPHVGDQFLADSCRHDSQGQLLLQKVLSLYLGIHSKCVMGWLLLLHLVLFTSL